MADSIIDAFVRDITLIVDNDEPAYNAVRYAVHQAADGGTTEYEKQDAAGAAAEEAVYDLVRHITDNNDFAGLLLGQFLGIGTDGWRKVGQHYRDDASELAELVDE